MQRLGSYGAVRLLTLCAAILSFEARPDAIDVKGVTYDNVYIRESSAFYYVQVPSTGRVLNVRKADTPPESVTLTKDRAKRAALLKQWKAMHRAAEPQAEKKTPETVPAPDAKPEIPLATNTSKRGGRTRPIFISKQGVVVCTNRPERYRNKDEYIEVALHLDRIAVPSRYRAPRKNGPAASARYTPAYVKDLVSYYSKQYGVDPNLVLAVIRQESGFAVQAASPKGACGLMQLMPGTALEMGVTDLFDPAQNIAGGTQYLARMLRLFDNDLDRALAGYNAGPGAVQRYNGVPPFAETQDYIARVKSFYAQYTGGKMSIASIDTAQPKPAEKTTAPYLVELKNGWTQPADEVAESAETYFVTIDHRTTQIRKQFVRAIRSPEKG